MSKDLPFPEATALSILSFDKQLYARQKQLELNLKSVRDFREILNILTRYVSSPWPFHVLDLWKRKGDFIRQQAEYFDVSFAELDKIRQTAALNAEKLWTWYPNLLEEACRKNSLPLDMTSRHPVYTFEKKFFELTVNHNGTAIISDPERKLEEFPGDIGAAVEKIRNTMRGYSSIRSMAKHS